MCSENKIESFYALILMFFKIWTDLARSDKIWKHLKTEKDFLQKWKEFMSVWKLSLTSMYFKIKTDLTRSHWRFFVLVWKDPKCENMKFGEIFATFDNIKTFIFRCTSSNKKGKKNFILRIKLKRRLSVPLFKESSAYQFIAHMMARGED